MGDFEEILYVFLDLFNIRVMMIIISDINYLERVFGDFLFGRLNLLFNLLLVSYFIYKFVVVLWYGIKMWRG